MHHKDLEAWKEAINFVTKIYSVTNDFPKEEIYGIVSQIRRCAISIPSNLAEGCARPSSKDTSRFIDIALGSVAELETQLIISQNLGYINNLNELLENLNKISALIYGLKKYLNKNLSHIVT